MVRLRFLSAVAVLSCAASSTFGQGSDTVRVRKGGEIKEEAEVVVTQDDLKGVKARRGAATINFQLADVVEVVYGRKSEAFKTGFAKFKSQDYDEALKSFEEALGDEDDKKTHPWVANYCLWYSGQCLELTGDAGRAADVYNELVSKHATSRFVPDALAALGNLYLEAKKVDQAKGFFDKLAEVAKKEALGDRYAMKADLGAAKVGVEKGDAGAVAALEAIAGKAAADSPDVAAEARLEVGRFHFKKKDYAKAETVFRTLSSGKSVAPRGFAGAANGLADCEFEQGKFQDAAFSYSKVYTLMLPHQDDPTVAQAIGWALYRGGKAADLHKGTLPDSDATKVAWGRRGRFLMREAVRKFAATRGGAEAKKELGL